MDAPARRARTPCWLRQFAEDLAGQLPAEYRVRLRGPAPISLGQALDGARTTTGVDPGSCTATAETVLPLDDQNLARQAGVMRRAAERCFPGYALHWAHGLRQDTHATCLWRRVATTTTCTPLTDASAYFSRCCRPVSHSSVTYAQLLRAACRPRAHAWPNTTGGGNQGHLPRITADDVRASSRRTGRAHPRPRSAR